MKIVGRTDTGYLVEATEAELANIAGHAYPNQAPWAELTKSTGYGGAKPIPTGTKIEVTKRFQHLEVLQRREKEVRDAAATLRALADLMVTQMPSVKFPPEPEPAPEPEAGS